MDEFHKSMERYQHVMASHSGMEINDSDSGRLFVFDGMSKIMRLHAADATGVGTTLLTALYRLIYQGALRSIMNRARQVRIGGAVQAVIETGTKRRGKRKRDFHISRHPRTSRSEGIVGLIQLTVLRPRWHPGVRSSSQLIERT